MHIYILLHNSIFPQTDVTWPKTEINIQTINCEYANQMVKVVLSPVGNAICDHNISNSCYERDTTYPDKMITLYGDQFSDDCTGYEIQRCGMSLNSPCPEENHKGFVHALYKLEFIIYPPTKSTLTRGLSVFLDVRDSRYMSDLHCYENCDNWDGGNDITIRLDIANNIIYYADDAINVPSFGGFMQAKESEVLNIWEIKEQGLLPCFEWQSNIVRKYPILSHPAYNYNNVVLSWYRPEISYRDFISYEIQRMTYPQTVFTTVAVVNDFYTTSYVDNYSVADKFVQYRIKLNYSEYPRIVNKTTDQLTEYSNTQKFRYSIAELKKYSKGIKDSATVSNPTTCQVYPNPFNSEASFMITSNHNSKAELLIFNILGQLILTEKFILLSGLNRKSISLDNQPSGIYYFILKSEYEESPRHKGKLINIK